MMWNHDGYAQKEAETRGIEKTIAYIRKLFFANLVNYSFTASEERLKGFSAAQEAMKERLDEVTWDKVFDWKAP